MIGNVERIARELRHLLKNRRNTSAATIEQALYPLATFAVRRLKRLVPDNVVLSAPAVRSLVDHIGNRLMFALGPCLRIEQLAVRALSRSSKGKKTRIKLAEAFDDFPGLLDTTTHLLSAWLDAQSELLIRLKRDTATLRKHFGLDRCSLRAIAIRPGLSDPHDAGRSVTLVEFAGNRRLIYKPRSCDGEELWASALRWLNQNGVAPRFRIPVRLARKDYHWMEVLRATRCGSLAAVRAFYVRWGAQAALAQILCASDLHWENWLAVGAQPILLDAELVVEDRRPLSPLLQTGLVPLTARDRAGLYKEIAPFDDALPKTARERCWPSYRAGPQAPRKHVKEILSGFESVRAILPTLTREFFEQVLQPALPAHNKRVLFRASAEYARLLRESLEPAQMSSRNKRWRWLVRQCRVSANSRSIALAEARALLRCDIPKFTTRKRTDNAASKGLLVPIKNLEGSLQILRGRILPGSHRRR